ncbi:hypothetical protein SH661x_000937 [Planctomicrobium sp. SH661]|uniref:hypothetical protein n=1 Tax=Planctomicrobium sp. SH661 TaxID=3448124 RepID=UPI003F5B32A0
MNTIRITAALAAFGMISSAAHAQGILSGLFSPVFGNTQATSCNTGACYNNQCQPTYGNTGIAPPTNQGNWGTAQPYFPNSQTFTNPNPMTPRPLPYQTNRPLTQPGQGGLLPPYNTQQGQPNWNHHNHGNQNSPGLLGNPMFTGTGPSMNSPLLSTPQNLNGWTLY